MTPAEFVVDVVERQGAFKPGDVKPTDSIFDDLRLDSLDIVEMVMEIEGEYGWDMDADDEAFKKIVTVQDLINYVEARVKGAGV